MIRRLVDRADPPGATNCPLCFERLGYFLDLHETDVRDDVRATLLALVRPQSKIQLGSRRKWGTTGKLVRPWSEAPSQSMGFASV